MAAKEPFEKINDRFVRRLWGGERDKRQQHPTQLYWDKNNDHPYYKFDSEKVTFHGDTSETVWPDWDESGASYDVVAELVTGDGREVSFDAMMKTKPKELAVAHKKAAGGGGGGGGGGGAKVSTSPQKPKAAGAPKVGGARVKPPARSTKAPPPDAMVRVVPTDAATVEGGGFTLHLPAGSVSEAVEIVFRRLPAGHEAAADAEAEADLRSDVWSLEPHGLQLLKPATLTLALAKPGCEHVAVLHRDQAEGSDWEVLVSQVDSSSATAELRSFSYLTVGGCVVHCRVRPLFSMVRNSDGPTLIAKLEAAVHHANAAGEEELRRADSDGGFFAGSKQLFEEGTRRSAAAANVLDLDRSAVVVKRSREIELRVTAGEWEAVDQDHTILGSTTFRWQHENKHEHERRGYRRRSFELKSWDSETHSETPLDFSSSSVSSIPDSPSAS